MNLFLSFINNHNIHFKKYDKIEEVENITEEGWLYIFNAFCYDNDITQILPENTDKFGKTIQMLPQRLKVYKKDIKMLNIEAINCTQPDERERLIKAYLKHRLDIKATVGQEYFTNSRNLIKVLMLILVFITDEDIVMYEKYYEEDNLEYNKLFDKIDNYINIIKNDKNFKLKIINDISLVRKIEKEKLKKEYYNKLKILKLEYQLNLAILNKKSKNVIQLKKEHIKLLKSNNNNINDIININDNIINLDEYNILFKLIKPITSVNLIYSIKNIKYDKMIDNDLESPCNYFISEFIKNFKDYILVIDRSSDNVITKLENNQIRIVQCYQFILDCFKICDKELKNFFIDANQYMNLKYPIKEMSSEEISSSEMSPEEYICYSQKNY